MNIKLSVSILALATGSATAQDLPQASNAWFSAGEAAVEERLARQTNANRARNAILLVSDGNGVGTNYATRLCMGQQQVGFGDAYVLHHETLPRPW